MRIDCIYLGQIFPLYIQGSDSSFLTGPLSALNDTTQVAFRTVPSPGEQSLGKVAMVIGLADLATATLGAAGLQVIIPALTVQLPRAWEVLPRILFLKGIKGLGPANTTSKSSRGAADSLQRDVNEGPE